MKYLSILDIFGVEFKQQIQLNVKEQKSTIGEIASILIIGTSLAYLVYVFKQWINYELLPKSSTNMEVEEQSSFNYNETENFFEFLYRNITNNKIDPFTPTNNILTPLGLYFENGTLVQTISFLNQTSEKSTYSTFKYGLNQINLSQNTQADSAQLNVREFMLVFIKCNETYLSEGQSCASEEQFQQFFQTANNYLLFKIHLKEFNSATKQNKVVTKTYYITIDSEIATQGRLFIKQTHAYIDTGRVMESKEKETFVQEATFLTFSTRTNFLEYIESDISIRSCFNLASYSLSKTW